MEGKNIYLSVFPEFLGLLSFCLLKLTKDIDLQVMRVTMMFRITRLSLSTGWNKKIRITLSTVASSVTVKRVSVKPGTHPEHPGTPRNTPGTPPEHPGTPMEHPQNTPEHPRNTPEHPIIPRNTLETARNTPEHQ